MKLYSPREDSFFLSLAIKKELGKLSSIKNSRVNALDLGSGSCIQAENLSSFGISKKNIFCVDIDKEAVTLARKKGFPAFKSDLFKNKKLENKKFDLIIFNPPYLPEDKSDKNQDTCGGKFGDETILRFLKHVRNHLTKQGKIFLLLSSLTPRRRIQAEIKKQKFQVRKLAVKDLFFEKLEVWEINR